MADQKQFVHENNDALACFAYARYRLAGRGVLAFVPELFLQKSDPIDQRNLFYLTRSELLSLIPRWTLKVTERDRFRNDLLKTVDTYDPSTSIIVSFLSTEGFDDQIRTYVVDCATPPPLAYAMYTN
jgi:hypothetical protein